MAEQPVLAKPCHVYIFRELYDPVIKIGSTDDEPSARLASALKKARVRKSAVEIYREWAFSNRYAMKLVESYAITLLDSYRIKRVRPQDWFRLDLDKFTLEFFADSVDRLASQITGWHSAHHFRSCDPFANKESGWHRGFLERKAEYKANFVLMEIHLGSLERGQASSYVDVLTDSEEG